MRSGSVRKRSAEDHLMCAFGEGDEAALQELFIRFGADVYGIGLHCFRSPDVADAFLERTFVTLWHRSSQYVSSSVPLETWVVVEALRVALQMSVSRAGEPPRAGSVGRTKTDGDHAVARVEPTREGGSGILDRCHTPDGCIVLIVEDGHEKRA